MDQISINYRSHSTPNVVVELPSRDLRLYLFWWDYNCEGEDRPGFEQQLDVACHICRSVEDIIRHMHINGFDVDLIPTEEVEK